MKDVEVVLLAELASSATPGNCHWQLPWQMAELPGVGGRGWQINDSVRRIGQFRMNTDRKRPLSAPAVFALTFHVCGTSSRARRRRPAVLRGDDRYSSGGPL